MQEDCATNGRVEPKAEGFNPRTASSHDVRAAIKGLQKALGVRQDGYMGPATTGALHCFLSGTWPFGFRHEKVTEIVDDRLQRIGTPAPGSLLPPQPTPGIDKLQLQHRMTARVDERGRFVVNDGRLDTVLYDPEAVLDEAMAAFAAHFGADLFPTPAPYHGMSINWPAVREAMSKALTAANEASAAKVL